MLYWADETEELNPEDSLSDNSEGLLQRGKGGAKFIRVLQHKPGS